MKILAKVCIGIAGAALSIAVIAGVTTASVIGIKTLYQHLNPASEAISSSDYKLSDTIDDVMEFTDQVAEFTKNIGR